jgi:hypothetical protein
MQRCVIPGCSRRPEFTFDGVAQVDGAEQALHLTYPDGELYRSCGPHSFQVVQTLSTLDGCPPKVRAVPMKPPPDPDAPPLPRPPKLRHPIRAVSPRRKRR